MKPEELQQLPGFGKDHEANLKEAKRLLAEAGYPDGFKTVLTNRAIKLPYIDLGVYLVSAWKKIGVEAEHRAGGERHLEQTRLNRDFDLLVNPFGYAAWEIPMRSWISFTTGATENWGRFSDPVVDKLFEQQKVERDEQKRIQLVKDMQKRLMEKTWELMACGGAVSRCGRRVSATTKPMPNHWLNRRLEDVWLAIRIKRRPFTPLFLLRGAFKPGKPHSHVAAAAYLPPAGGGEVGGGEVGGSPGGKGYGCGPPAIQYPPPPTSPRWGEESETVYKSL